MDPLACLTAIVCVAGAIRSNYYTDLSEAAESSAYLAENCIALAEWTAKGGFLPGETMPWDGGNHRDVLAESGGAMNAWDASNDMLTFAYGVRLAERITMVNMDHLV
jgi:hypothetical protein